MIGDDRLGIPLDQETPELGIERGHRLRRLCQHSIAGAKPVSPPFVREAHGEHDIERAPVLEARCHEIRDAGVVASIMNRPRPARVVAEHELLRRCAQGVALGEVREINRQSSFDRRAGGA